MASKVTRDHHNFRRTVSLNGNKISNDGGDEGISVADNGNVTLSGDLDIDGSKITSAGALEIDAGGTVSITGAAVTIDAGEKFGLDSGGNTYIIESSADIISFFAGGTSRLNLSSAAALFNDTVALATTEKLHFDGTALGANTYIVESSADVLDFYVGAVNLLKLTEAGGGASDKVSIPALTPLYFDGGGDTYIAEIGTDTLSIVVGGDTLITILEAGGDGNVVDMRDSAAGFTQHEPVYDADDTNVYFNRAGNKAFLTFGSGNITDIHLKFPNVSCNCVLLVRQDGSGSRTITNYKTFDQAGGNESTVLFAGGSNPVLTTTADKTDIFSFYWDNDNHIAYGTVTHNF